MKATRKVITILNDLVLVNGDRIYNYERAARAIQGSLYAEYTSLFFTLAENSRRYMKDIIAYVMELDGEPVDISEAGEARLQQRQKLEEGLIENDLKSLLDFCLRTEAVAMIEYQEALEEDVNWPAAVLQLISTQRSEIRDAQDKVKRYQQELPVAHV